MRRFAGIALVAVLAVVALVLLSTGSIKIGSTPPPAKANDNVRALGELGPGVCWPEDQRPGNGEGFAEKDGPAKAAAWFKNPGKRKAEAERDLDNYDAWLNAHKGYYLVTEVVPNWDKLGNNQTNRRSRVIAYITKMEAHRLKQPMTVVNTFCDKKQNGKVTIWETQTLPVGEWLGFVPGHGPGSKDPRPAFKLVCGNVVSLTNTKPNPSNPTTQPPGKPKCEHNCTTPPPGCEKGCTTTPPPSGKKPNEDPGPKGNAPVGSGKNEDPGPGKPKPYNPPPSEAYKPPPPPADDNKPPAGSKPTQHNPPPPEPGANPTTGGPNTGDPGGF